MKTAGGFPPAYNAINQLNINHMTDTVLSVLNSYKSDKNSNAMNVAIDNFINGVTDGVDTYNIVNYDNPFLFVEDVCCVLADPTTMGLSDFDADVIDCMNLIAHDIRDLL